MHLHYRIGYLSNIICHTVSLEENPSQRDMLRREFAMDTGLNSAISTEQRVITKLYLYGIDRDLLVAASTNQDGAVK